MTVYIYRIAILVSLVVLTQSVFADVKIKSKQTMSGQSYENTTYIKGARQRTETMNGSMVNLTQCDLRRGIQMNPQAKTYMVNPFAETTQSTTKPAASSSPNGVVVAGGTVTTTVTTKDTGERKQMFGFTARHLIITMETVSSPDACNKNDSKMQTDGWYIDAEFALDCDYGVAQYSNNRNVKPGGCQDKYQMKQIGTAKRGYPVYEKMTMFDAFGKEMMSYVNEVVELSKTTLDGSLFDVPQDYTQVTDPSQMYSAGVATPSVSTDRPALSTLKLPGTDGPEIPSSGGERTPGGDSGSSLGPKKAGVVRVGIAGVKTGTVGEGVSATDLAAAVHSTLVQYLKGPRVEAVTLDAKLPSAIDNEAKEKECDYIVYATVSHKKGGGFGGMLGSAFGSAIGRVGIGQTGSTVGNIAGQIATQAIVSATTVSASVRSKDEISIDLKLNNAAGVPIMAKIYKAKAKANGDDIISQVIEQAAEAVVNLIAQG